jgi:hypothetical protein
MLTVLGVFAIVYLFLFACKGVLNYQFPWEKCPCCGNTVKHCKEIGRYDTIGSGKVSGRMVSKDPSLTEIPKVHKILGTITCASFGQYEKGAALCSVCQTMTHEQFYKCIEASDLKKTTVCKPN